MTPCICEKKRGNSHTEDKAISSREFKQDMSKAKKEASIAELLGMPEAADIDFEPPRLELGWRQPDETGRLLEETKE